MNTVSFDYIAKYGHFLRAEANCNGLTYPVPPRTALLGLVGAILGLDKDAPQEVLAGANLAVGGRVPQRMWHKTNVRKDPPAPLLWTIKPSSKGTESEQRNFRFPQEWLWLPRFRVWASLHDPYHEAFLQRVTHRRWHFTPCMGLSEMLADVVFVQAAMARSLPQGIHQVTTVVPQKAGRVDIGAACKNELAIHSLRMPRALTADRVFSHATYLLEHEGRPFPVETDQAWQVGQEVVVFL